MSHSLKKILVVAVSAALVTGVMGLAVIRPPRRTADTPDDTFERSLPQQADAAPQADAASGDESPPRIATERVVLRTNLGDLVLALYPDVAPQHVAQILNLVRLGAYDTTSIWLVDPSYLIQISNAENRQTALTTEQLEAIHPLKAEFSSLRHRRGTLSMAREDDRPDSAATSFIILTVDAPHLDGQYTIFGHLESGYDVLDAICQVKCSSDHRPIKPLQINEALVAASPEALDKVGPRHAKPTADSAAAALSGHVLVPVGLMMICGLATFLLANRVSPKAFASLGALTFLIGFFVFYMELVPRANASQWLGLSVFLAAPGLFRMMSRFESAR